MVVIGYQQNNGVKMIRNALDVTKYGFYKDPELRLPLGQDNLYDQIDTDGWVSLYYGGHSIFIPQIGDFNTFVFCNTTFFWDIMDENNRRVKTGVKQLFISRNVNKKVWYGDLIPSSPEEVFDYYSPDTAAPEDVPLICSNIWFYNNLFLDEYYRYNLIVLHKDYEWPDDNNAVILPMNDRLHLPKDHYIVGYRPKPEYLFKLAVMPRIKSGKENAIHFRIKMDIDFLNKHPGSYRQLRIFAMTNDSPQYMIYPEVPEDIIWDNYHHLYVPEYKRYLLEWGINGNLPGEAALQQIYKKKEYLIKYSRILSQLDSFNFKDVVDNYKKKADKPNYKMVGLPKYLYKPYKIWEEQYTNDKQPVKQMDILNYILFKKTPFNGFQRLYNALYNVNEHVNNALNTSDEEIKKHYIVMKDGVKQFNTEYVPDNARGYLDPPQGYYYAGNTGNGMYLIRVNGVPTPVWCDMKNGGWMMLINGVNFNLDYVNSLFKEPVPEDAIIEDKGLAFPIENGSRAMTTNIKYKDVKVGLVDIASNCGFMKLEIFGDKDRYVYNDQGYTDECKSVLILGDDIEYDENTEERGDYYEVTGKKENKLLNIKYTALHEFKKVLKYVKFLWVR